MSEMVGQPIGNICTFLPIWESEGLELPFVITECDSEVDRGQNDLPQPRRATCLFCVRFVNRIIISRKASGLPSK